MVYPPAAQALIRLSGWRGAYLALGGLVLAVGLPIVVRFVRERPSAQAGAAGAVDGASVREALRSRVFWILVIVIFGSMIASNGAIVHLSALLTDRGVSASRAAFAVSAMGGASLAGRLLTGWLLDRFPAPRVSFALLALAALGTFLLADARSFATGVLAAVLLGFGIGGEIDVTPYLLSRYFGLRSLSTLYGLTWTAVGTAGAVGPVLMGRAFDATGSYETVLLQLAASILGSALLMLTLPNCPISSCPVLSSCPDPASPAK
jgi:predicted MFS family arabinose efflux permease